MKGLFISFEGVDGVGKTTQVDRLRAYLEEAGREVVVTREPGGTALGRAIRALLLHGVPSDSADADRRYAADAAADERTAVPARTSTAAPADIAPRAEALLFAADRAQHVAQVIRPALARGAVVITDRYIDSSLAYQAGGRELTAAEIRNLSVWATGDLFPARTYLLDMDPARSHSRLQHAEDRMESAGDGFQQRTRQAFLDLASAEPSRFRVIDAARGIDDVWAAIRADVDALVGSDAGRHDVGHDAECDAGGEVLRLRASRSAQDDREVKLAQDGKGEGFAQDDGDARSAQDDREASSAGEPSGGVRSAWDGGNRPINKEVCDE